MISYLILGIIFVLGAFIGSFLNLVSDRIQTKETIVKGRSHCDFCQHKLTPPELIPIFSFLMHKGKSSCCHKKLSYYYPISEFLTALGSVAIVYFSGILTVFSIQQLIYVLFLSFMFFIYIIIFLSDLKFRIIPNRLILIGVIVTIIYLVTFLAYTNLSYYNALKQDPFGVYLIKVGYFSDKLLLSLKSFGVRILSSLLIWCFFVALIIITRGRGMGVGDAKLGILIGLVNGFPYNVLAIFLGFILGAVYSVVFLVTRKTTLKDTIPFGPFLILGSIIAMYWGDVIIRWYIGF